MMEPSFGDEVLVKPSHENLRVQEHGSIPGRIMANEWSLRLWDDWLHRRFVSGEITIKYPDAPPAEDKE